MKWSEISARTGRNDLPVLLENYFEDLEVEDRAKALSHAWSACEWPCRVLDIEDWVAMFEDVGFTVDGHTAALTDVFSTETITVYRGCHKDSQRGLSWTTDIERARWFRDRLPHRADESVLLRADVPVRFILAVIDGRGEREIVVSIEDAVFFSDMSIEVMSDTPVPS